MDSGDDIFLTQSVFTPEETVRDDFQYRSGEPLCEKDIEKKTEVAGRKKTTAMKENLLLPASCLYMPLLRMDKECLNTALKYFIFEARKQNGSEYPANSIYALYAAIQSSLRENRVVINLFEDNEFREARKCLDAAMRNLSKKGLGISNRKMTKIISSDEEDLLWKNGAEFRLARWKGTPRLFSKPQITGPHVDEKGRRYILYNDVSKTNHGGLKDHKVPKEVRAYENNQPSRC
ncbi:hypothetical protein LOTGIDRAFT_172875 [Lottia gigantea]|uniref:QRICH1-like domain-containing protein n=1 Tax=Lottia gigantea TaxID=225164 RepID=V4AUQ7_LOTGI|nr:hypothetical protein LOTGIDRAFT_172875 [Lottia gigantea]ESP01043.1 hypothetical protein LOTGIDRAFT_172875 [Lottia gigantea]